MFQLIFLSALLSCAAGATVPQLKRAFTFAEGVPMQDSQSLSLRSGHGVLLSDSSPLPNTPNFFAVSLYCVSPDMYSKTLDPSSRGLNLPCYQRYICLMSFMAFISFCDTLIRFRNHGLGYIPDCIINTSLSTLLYLFVSSPTIFLCFISLI